MSDHSAEKRYLLWESAIDILVGKVLTVIDASISSQVQNKAIKDVLKPLIWHWVNEYSLCPKCKNGGEISKLKKVSDQGHCDLCNMYYDK